jgi:hypothetical protein
MGFHAVNRLPTLISRAALTTWSYDGLKGFRRSYAGYHGNGGLCHSRRKQDEQMNFWYPQGLTQRQG